MDHKARLIRNVINFYKGTLEVFISLLFKNRQACPLKGFRRYLTTPDLFLFDLVILLLFITNLGNLLSSTVLCPI